LLLFFFSFAKIKFSGNFLDDLHFGYIAKSFKKKPWLEGGAQKNTKMKKAYGGGAGYLPSNFVLYPCVAVRRKKRRSARSPPRSL